MRDCTVNARIALNGAAVIGRNGSVDGISVADNKTAEFLVGKSSEALVNGINRIRQIRWPDEARRWCRVRCRSGICRNNGALKDWCQCSSTIQKVLRKLDRENTVSPGSMGSKFLMSLRIKVQRVRAGLFANPVANCHQSVNISRSISVSYAAELDDVTRNRCARERCRRAGASRIRDDVGRCRPVIGET